MISFAAQVLLHCSFIHWPIVTSLGFFFRVSFPNTSNPVLTIEISCGTVLEYNVLSCTNCFQQSRPGLCMLLGSCLN
ncbi:hypothetical protein HD806DRAFT_488641 [Xylariaceae sp. AK1471]|nr:hypothetical protein HD806DRAFT_488641 [Xylariaceae sp. AK1471]